MQGIGASLSFWCIRSGWSLRVPLSRGCVHTPSRSPHGPMRARCRAERPRRQAWLTRRSAWLDLRRPNLGRQAARALRRLCVPRRRPCRGGVAVATSRRTSADDASWPLEKAPFFARRRSSSNGAQSESRLPYFWQIRLKQQGSTLIFERDPRFAGQWPRDR